MNEQHIGKAATEASNKLMDQATPFLKNVDAAILAHEDTISKLKLIRAHVMRDILGEDMTKLTNAAGPAIKGPEVPQPVTEEEMAKAIADVQQ